MLVALDTSEESLETGRQNTDAENNRISCCGSHANRVHNIERVASNIQIRERGPSSMQCQHIIEHTHVAIRRNRNNRFCLNATITSYDSYEQTHLYALTW